jgi:methylglutaconyl-CoA hydratase
VFRRIGEGNARRYFLSGERFDAVQAKELGLVQDVVRGQDLEAETGKLVSRLLRAGPDAMKAAKRLAFRMAGHDESRQLETDEYTAKLIAQLRVSAEGQEGLSAFLEKREPSWLPPRGE